MSYKIKFTPQGESDLLKLENDPSLAKRLKSVRKAIGLLSINPRHPSLNTHKFKSMTNPIGGDVFEAYAENNTSAAYRIFWCYGPNKGEISIIAITSHP